MRTQRGKGLSYKAVGGSYPSSAKTAAHRTKLQGRVWQICEWKSTTHFLWLVSRFVQREEPKLGDWKGKKIDEFSLFQHNYQQGAMHIVEVFTARVKVVKRESSHLFLTETPHFEHLPGQKSSVSWQPWNSSTIWCLCVGRESTEGFAVTDEICSPSNTPVKVILPLESQTIRFLSKRCLIPGN